MASALNVSVLCAAKEEYTNQLKHYLVPLIQEGITSIYEDAVINDEEGNSLRHFQIFLKQVPKWNQTILETETKRIKDQCEFLMDLVTAIFVSHVKILASVRLGGNHSNIKIKIPTSEIFIHSIYVNASERFYYEPYPFDNLLKRENIDKIKEIVDETIDETISSMIPIQSILQEYLCNTFTDHTKPPPLPEPEIPPPSDREFNGSELVNENPVDTNFDNDIYNNTNETKTVRFSDTPIFPIGDKPSFIDKLPQDLGETLEATAVGNPDPVEEDTSLGNMFTEDAMKEIPSEPIVTEEMRPPEFIENTTTTTTNESPMSFLESSESKNDDIFGLSSSPEPEPVKIDTPPETEPETNNDDIFGLSSSKDLEIEGMEEKPVEKDFNFFDNNDFL